MSISDKLTQLNTIKTNIKAAIIAKGGTATDDMTTYATSISNIPTGSSYTGDETWGTAVTYTITPTLTNCTAGASNPSTIEQGSTATLTFTATSGYTLPSSVTVTGATGTWTQATGTLVLSNPTGAVSFSITALVQLDAPVITASGTTLTLAEVTNATSYEVYADGTSIGEYTPVSGYTVTLSNSYGSTTPDAEDNYCRIRVKFNTAPTSADDYDYDAYSSTFPATINNVTKVYVWGYTNYSSQTDAETYKSYYGYTIGSASTLYDQGVPYSSAKEVTISENTTMVIEWTHGDGPS